MDLTSQNSQESNVNSLALQTCSTDLNGPNRLLSSPENVETAHPDSPSSETFDGQSHVSNVKSSSTCQDSLRSDNDVSELLGQLNLVSQRLAETQDQVDKLLDEKRSWLQSCNQGTNPSAVGELRGRWLQAKSLADTYKREKENMVMKYAQAEQKRIILEKRVLELEQKCQKTVGGPPTDHTPIADSNELPDKSTADEHESHQRFVQMEKALVSTREQVASLKKANASAESRIGELEKRINQTSESLREEQQKVSSQNITITRLNRSLESAMKEAKDAQRLREREAERLCAELAYQEAQEKLRNLTCDNELLRKEVDKMEALKNEMEECQSHLSEVLTENSVIPELRSELETLRQQEERSSTLIRTLTEQNVELQANHLAATSRLRELEDSMQAQEQLLRTTTEDSEKTISSERDRAQGLELLLQELRLQVQHLQERESRLVADLETEREQASTMRKRDAGRIRDLVRQLARVSQSRSAQFSVADNSETGQMRMFDPGAEIPSVVVDDHVSKSDGSSVYSVESSSNGPAELSPVVKSVPVVGNILMATGEADHHTPQSPVDGDHQCAVDRPDRFDASERTAWLAKLDRLHRAQVRLTDKVEFLQEHCCHLTEELSCKSRIIQSLLVGDQQTGAVSPPDPNLKSTNQTGSFLASFYVGKAGRDTPDLDTCLEINKKLQVVLEDALLRNIVFKDNLSTLGSEISRLTKLLEDIQELVCESCRNVITELRRSEIRVFNN